jgi:hypothetical protein
MGLLQFSTSVELLRDQLGTFLRKVTVVVKMQGNSIHAKFGTGIASSAPASEQKLLPFLALQAYCAFVR